jgi:DNA-binding MarR family transcriptional regulator
MVLPWSLIASGLVERHPAPNHGRILEACLTEQGEKVITACEEAAGALEAEMCAELEQEEVAVLESLLRRCAAGLGAPIRDQGFPPVRPGRPGSRSRI